MGVGTGSVTLLEPVLDAVPSPLLIVEPGTARVLYANAAADRFAGGAFPRAGAAESYARTYELYDESGRLLPGDEHPGVRAARGERFDNVAVDWVSATGRRSIVVSAHTVALDGTGELALVTFEDVTELQAARRRSALLAEAGSRLIRSLDPGDVARAVAGLCVPAHADWAFVELVRPDGTIARGPLPHADPAKQALVEEYERSFPLDPGSPVGSPAVIRTGEPQLIAEIPEEMLAAAAPDPRQLELLREVGLRSTMIVPLRARGRVIGDLALAHAESGRRYSQADLEVSQQLADRCALALDNARLYTELQTAEAAARRAGAEVNTILGGVADAVTAQAPDGTLIYANEAAVRIIGYDSVEALLSAPIAEVASGFEMLDEAGRPLGVEHLPGRRALAGEHPEPLIV